MASHSEIQYSDKDNDLLSLAVGGANWRYAKEQYEDAKDHMDVLTDSLHLRGS